MEGKIESKGRKMKMIGDDEVGSEEKFIEMMIKLIVFRIEFVERLEVIEVILIEEKEKKKVGIMIDGERLEKVGKLREFVVEDLKMERKMWKGDDRKIELIRKRIKEGGDLGDLMKEVMRGRIGREGNEMKIVDEEKVEEEMEIKKEWERGKMRDGNEKCMVDIERDIMNEMREGEEILKISLGNLEEEDFRGRKLSLIGNNKGGEMLGRNLEREKKEKEEIGRIYGEVGMMVRLVWIGDVEGDIGGKRGIENERKKGKDDKVRWMKKENIDIKRVNEGRNERKVKVENEGGVGNVKGGS